MVVPCIEIGKSEEELARGVDLNVVCGGRYSSGN